MPKITPFLWFDDNLEQAMEYYTSIFPNAKIVNVSRAGNAAGGKGKVFTATFELEGQRFIGLNGGPHFKFTEAISLFIDCSTQEEVDELWAKLSAGGEEGRCGWVKDRFGLWWQVVPAALGQMLGDRDPARAQRVMQAMLQMRKIDIAGLKRAYDQAA
jgi:predicted 3-demethylubiquinone-9 3-methyltransferase (glyoxalase superfamily)